jgi:hypothetical protein
MKKAFVLAIALALFFTVGCRSAAQAPIQPPIVTAEGALVLTEEAGSFTLRAYAPACTIIFNPQNNATAARVSVIVTNISTQSLKTSGLVPATIKILSPTSIQYEFTVPPQAPSTIALSTSVPPAYTFAVIGDNRDGRQTYLALIDRLNAVAPAFVINGGDLVSSGTASQYDQFIADSAAFQSPWLTIPGNHDIVNGGRTLYNRRLAPDYYDFTWGNAQFIMLDNADGSMSDQQLAWLENKLENRTTQHVFLFMHKPPFDPRPGQMHTVNSKALADRLISMAARYHVTAVFSSHIHMYYKGERLGVPYYITGGAGAPLYAQPAEGGIYHYLQVKIAGDQVSISPIKI